MVSCLQTFHIQMYEKAVTFLLESKGFSSLYARNRQLTVISLISSLSLLSQGFQAFLVCSKCFIICVNRLTFEILKQG